MRRAELSSTRDWTIGLEASRRRSDPANNRSTTCRFSSLVVGSSRLRSRPEPSRYVTREPSMKTSSMSGRLNRSVRGPNSARDRVTRSTMSPGLLRARPSPRWARR